MTPVNVGIVGCGLIAQIMHLPHLRELPEKFSVRALCDLSSEVLARVADDYHIARRYTDYLNLVTCDDIEAVLVLSSGNHAPIVQAALDAGKHVFVEKPMCFGLRDADRMIESSLRKGLHLMVGYMKWFDPAFQEAARLFKTSEKPRLVQITTIQTQEDFYFRHYRLHRYAPDPNILKQIYTEQASLLAAELPDIPVVMRDVYVDVLLDSAIHDVYMLRGLVGDPEELVQSSFWAAGRALHLSWRYTDDLQAHYTFVILDNPGGRYQETITCYGSKQRLLLDFPSPYLRNAPTELVIEEVVGDRIQHIKPQGSYEEAFKQELLHFHECISSGSTPLSSAIQGRKDIELMQAAIRAGVSKMESP